MTTIIQQLRDAQLAGDAVAYYAILEQNGDAYGRLAGGVVMSDALAGTVARSFAASLVKDVLGYEMTGAEWALISLGLMAQDLAAREDKLLNDGDPLNLSYEAIQIYHNLVFDDLNIPRDAWTANIPLNQSSDPEATWQAMMQMPDDWFWGFLSGAGNFLSTADATLLSLRLAVPGALLITDPPNRSEVTEEIYWGAHAINAFVSATIDAAGGSSSGSVQPFSVDLPNGGKFIGGADQIDDVLAGTSGDDVIIGYRGDDILGGTYGRDRIYGGEGDDYVHAGPDGGDLFYGGTHDEEGDTVHFNGNWQDYGITAVEGGFSFTLKNSQQAQTQAIEFEYFDFANASFTLEQMTELAKIITGTAGADTLHGTPWMDIISGLGGNDTIYGDASNDVVYGGADHDTIDGENGSDAMFGEAGNDVLNFGDDSAGSTMDLADGGANTDTLRARAGTTFEFTPAPVALRASEIPVGPFAAPTGPAFVASNAFGSVYGQRIEAIVALGGGNTLVAGFVSDITAAGVTSVNFSAGADDKVILNGKQYQAPVLTFSSSTVALTQPNTNYAVGSVVFSGVEEWNLNGHTVELPSNATTGHSSTIVITQEALAQSQGVVIRANGYSDLLDLSGLSSAASGVTFTWPGVGEVTELGGFDLYGIEHVRGGVGADTLTGNAGRNFINGGAGRDVIAGLGGADSINDSDWLVLDYSASNAGVKLDRASNGDTIFEGYGGHAQGDVVVLSWTSVRYDIIGSNFQDEILYAYEVFAGGGDDIITGSKIVHAGDGYDTVNVTSYTDYVDFGTGGGALKLADSTQRYFVDMDLGAYQRLSGSTVVHNLTVVGDYDKITGSNYNDTIYGTSGNDRIYGGGGTDTLVGRDGDDYIEGAGTLFGNSGNDTLIQTGNGVAWGDEGADILRATASGGVLVGGTGDDTLTAAATSVWLIGGAGADAMIGTGTSFLGYSTATTGVTLTSVNGSGSGSGGDAAGDVFSGILNIEGTTYADNFTVTMQNNAKLWAGAGNDTVIVWHNSNSSQLYGESGDDHITSLSTFGQTFGAEGNDTLIGGGTLDGGTGNDVIIGDNYNGVQIGGDGDDIIDSGAGDDTINFGTGGFDKFIFKTGHGRDSLFGAESHDVVQLVGIAAFSSIQDVADHMGFDYGSAYLEMGYKDDHPDIYGPNAPHEYIGSIRFFQQSISTVLGLDWQFA